MIKFQYSLVNKKVYKFIKNEILQRNFSGVMVEKSIIQIAKSLLALLTTSMSIVMNRKLSLVFVREYEKI